jgi:RNA polymerase sigma factor (sigma-70 family)
LLKLTEQYTDTKLLELFKQSKDSKWLGILFDRYALLVFGVCMKYLKQVADAQDATQQVFEKAYSEINKYEVSYFKSWIYSIAKHHCLMQLRRKGHQTIYWETIPEELQEDVSNQFETADKESFLEEQSESLTKALSQLNHEQKTCIELFYLEKLSYAAIEEKTGFSFQQVKSYIQNGKRNLKISIEQQQKGAGHE